MLTGNFEQALQYYLEYYKRTADKEDWHVEDDPNGMTQHSHACYCLVDVYHRLAELNARRDRAASLDYYIKAHQAAVEGECSGG